MRSIKSPKTLELERDDEVQKDPFNELFKPENIVERSRKFLTVSEAIPELSIIAREENLNLNIAKDFQECVRILDMKKLSR